jgi:hypothetical protein
MGVHRVRPYVRGAGLAAVPAARGTASWVLTLAAILTLALVAMPGSPAAARTARLAPSARLAGAARAATAAAPTLYVDNASGASCSDSGSGTESQPFCDIAVAAAAAQPGDTVMVEAGTYAGATISVSGTSSAPITFSALNVAAGDVEVQGGFVVSGAQNVVISGFNVIASPRRPVLRHRRHDHSRALPGSGPPGLSGATALQPGSPGTEPPGVPSRHLQADEPVKQVAVAPQRVAQALGVNAIAIPLVAQPAFAFLGAGH